MSCFNMSYALDVWISRDPWNITQDEWKVTPPFQLFLTEQEYFNKLNAKTIPTVCPLIFCIYFSKNSPNNCTDFHQW
jgi:hypothetical protein